MALWSYAIIVINKRQVPGDLLCHLLAKNVNKMKRTIKMKQAVIQILILLQVLDIPIDLKICNYYSKLTSKVKPSK